MCVCMVVWASLPKGAVHCTKNDVLPGSGRSLHWLGGGSLQILGFYSFLLGQEGEKWTKKLGVFGAFHDLAEAQIRMLRQEKWAFWAFPYRKVVGFLETPVQGNWTLCKHFGSAYRALGCTYLFSRCAPPGRCHDDICKVVPVTSRTVLAPHASPNIGKFAERSCRAVRALFGACFDCVATACWT